MERLEEKGERLTFQVSRGMCFRKRAERCAEEEIYHSDPSKFSESSQITRDHSSFR